MLITTTINKAIPLRIITISLLLIEAAMAQTEVATSIIKTNTIVDTKVQVRITTNQTIAVEAVNTIICNGTLVVVDEVDHKDKTSTATQTRCTHLQLHLITPHKI